MSKISKEEKLIQDLLEELTPQLEAEKQSLENKPKISSSDLYIELAGLNEACKDLLKEIQDIKLKIIKLNSHHPNYVTLSAEIRELLKDFLLKASIYNLKHETYGHLFVNKGTLPEDQTKTLPMNLKLSL